MHKYQPIVHITSKSGGGRRKKLRLKYFDKESLKLIFSFWRNDWREKKLPLPTDNIHNSHCLSEPAGVRIVLVTQGSILSSENTLFKFSFTFFIHHKCEDCKQSVCHIFLRIACSYLCSHWQCHNVIIYLRLLQITKLKIASNPFAKGFREATRGRDSGLIPSGQVGGPHQQYGQDGCCLYQCSIKEGKLMFLLSGKFKPQPLSFLLWPDTFDAFVSYNKLSTLVHPSTTTTTTTKTGTESRRRGREEGEKPSSHSSFPPSPSHLVCIQQPSLRGELSWKGSNIQNIHIIKH